MQSTNGKNIKDMEETKGMPPELKIIWSENQYLHDMSIENDIKIFRSLNEFDKALTCAAESAPERGYHKTKFIINYKGDEYIGRFDLHHVSKPQETSTGKMSSAQHIKDYVTYLLNQSDKYLPTPADKESAAIWLDLANQSLKIQ